ncbi:MAG: M48 family metallopeptidase [Nisaea sp.]|uniref:M48 family metallopeptidase n=1 Tax=Nisaea sp. TaxID=2024842 RepID=UPI001B2C673C|nr:SprT family zinc-dependent metalloprotease [Nisaea sp.]MBO6561152.1 M48 family metallopeptidase [Nisaea sp.]
MPDLIIGNTVVPYTLRRSASARKARITVTPDQVELVVPEAANEDQIARVLESKRAWIYEHHQRMAERSAEMHTIHRFMTGAKVPYRGRLVRLTVQRTDKPVVSVEYRNGFLVSVPEWVTERNREAVIEGELRLWFKVRLRRDTREMARRLGEPAGLVAKAIRIKDQKHMWGSCGRDRVVNLNWRLIFAPKAVLEYAVAHELAHLEERNHTSAFWSLVRRLVPDYERRKDWLEANEHVLGYRYVPVEI